MLFSQPGEHLFQLVFSILSCKFKYCVTREACPWELGTQCPLMVAVLSLFSLHLNSLHGAYYNLAHAHAHTQHTNTCIHINRHKHIYTHIRSFPHTCTHIYIHVHPYTYIHMYTHVYTHTHMIECCLLSPTIKEPAKNFDGACNSNTQNVSSVKSVWAT